MKGSLLVSLTAAFTAFGGCTLTIDRTALTGPDLQCSEAEKQCDVDGEPECVASDNPDFGCASPNCAPCYLNKATATCSPGTQACIVAACIGTWENCDRTDANGCEIDINTDPEHCGGCDAPCPAREHAEIRCGSARCYIRVCEEGFGDCNEELADGCETDLRGSPLHCGACGEPCAGSCQEGTCVP